MYLKLINVGVFMMCNIAAAQNLPTEMLPVTLELDKSIRIELPKGAGMGDKPLLEVKLQIQNAAAGTEIIVEDAATGDQVGVISPFGRIGRDAMESFLIPLKSRTSAAEMPLNFVLRQQTSDTTQKITIESLTLQNLK